MLAVAFMKINKPGELDDQILENAEIVEQINDGTKKYNYLFK